MTDRAVLTPAEPRGAAVPTRDRILDAVDQVAAAFPFRNYIQESVRQGLTQIIPRIARHVRAARPRLLDIGCGPMDKTAVMHRLGFECYAVDDLSDPWHRRDGNLEKIVSFAEREGIQFHLQDAEYRIPFPAESFDVVTIFDVIEHLHQSPRDILNAAGTHLRPGGVLAITMPNSVNLRKRLDVLRGRSNYPPVDQFFLSCDGWRGHVREYTLAETAHLCRLAGFEVLSATSYEGNAYDMLRGLRRQLFLALARLAPGLGSGLCVVARRPEGWKPVQPDPEAFRRAQAGTVPDAVL
ncbi:MAG TPA: class I SAM-dependent methyltransferase [Longimicrobium sp.]|nr:class I SAM-dependent methyltransferase [Longimicrobium sp.]